MDYVVYVARHEDIVLYVGEGKRGREQHLTSGVSHCYDANKFHFKGIRVDVEVVSEFTSKDEAKKEEGRLIRDLNPLWNKVDTSFDSVRARSEYRKTLTRITENGLLTNKNQILFMDFVISKVWRDGCCVLSNADVERGVGVKQAARFLCHLADSGASYSPKKLRRLVQSKKLSGSEYLVSLTEFFKRGGFDVV